jgi:hypothetical protein
VKGAIPEQVPTANEEQARRVPTDCALAEDEAAFETRGQTVMGAPNDFAPAIRELIAKHAK